MKLLYCALLPLLLLGCTPEKSEEASPSTKPTPNQAKPVETLVVYQGVDACKKALPKSQDGCIRGQGIATAMHLLDAPKFSSQKLCDEVFKGCMPHPQDKGKFLPQSASFVLRGNTDNKISKDSPALIDPVYVTAKGETVLVRKAQENLYSVVSTADTSKTTSLQTK